MHESEADDLIQCIDCGAEISPGADRGYLVNDEQVLCYACSIRRGGAWDSAHERWQKSPDLSGLPDERRPHD